MNKLLYEMLKSSAESDKSKALLSLELLGEKAVGIGDHSTEDFYKNAEEALALLVDDDDRLSTLENIINHRKKFYERTYKNILESVEREHENMIVII